MSLVFGKILSGRAATRDQQAPWTDGKHAALPTNPQCTSESKNSPDQWKSQSKNYFSCKWERKQKILHFVSFTFFCRLLGSNDNLVTKFPSAYTHQSKWNRVKWKTIGAHVYKTKRCFFFLFASWESCLAFRGKSELQVIWPGRLGTFSYNKYKYIRGFSFLWTETKISLFSTSMHSYEFTLLMTNYNCWNNAKL